MNFQNVQLSSEVNKDLSILKFKNGYKSKSELLSDILKKIKQDPHLLRRLDIVI